MRGAEGGRKKGGKGASIAYTIADSSLGRLLVAVTERGVCAVSLGDDDSALAAGLRDEYPAAAITPALPRRAPDRIAMAPSSC